MKLFIISLFSILTIFLFSCNGEPTKNQPSESNNTPPSKVKVMEKSVMKVHDDAMARMDLIYRLKKQVKQLTDSLLQDSTTHSEKLAVAKKNIELLEVADESMMSWMRTYRKPKDKSETEAMEYLEAEKVKIEAVSKLMNDNIAAAETFLKEQKTE